MMNNAVIAKPVIENPDPAAVVVAAGAADVACVVTFEFVIASIRTVLPGWIDDYIVSNKIVQLTYRFIPRLLNQRC
jgi:hypothetical protein